MKKGIILILLVTLLVACSNASTYHDTVRETFGKDTETVRDIVIEAFENEREFTEEEQEKIDSYIYKYDNSLDSRDESHAYLLTRNLIEKHSSSLLPSEIESILKQAENIQITLEGGFEAYKESTKD